MQYAAFFEATEGDTLQVLITPTPSGVAVFRRYTRKDGSRGRAAAWERYTVPTYMNDGDPSFAALGSAPVVRKPSAIKVTETDLRQIVEKGVPSTLTIKGQAAYEKSGAVSATPISQVTQFMYGLVSRQDETLLDYHQDGRSQRKAKVVQVAPAISVHTPEPEPVALPEPVTVTGGSSNPNARMALVPPIEVASKYIHRKIAGVDDFAVFENALLKQENVLIYGPTGAGKTMAALAFAASKGMPTFTISGSVNFDPSQAFGRERIREGQVVWADGGATDIARHGGVLILDEINFIPSKVMTPLFPLLDDRRQITLLDNNGEVIPRHPNTLIVATMNKGYIGTQQMNQAVVNRFMFHINWGYDEAVETKLIPLKSVREFANALRKAEEMGTVQTPTPTNAIADFVELAQTFDLDFAIENFKSRYEDTEQAAIKLALDANRANIEADLNAARGFNPSVAI